MTLNLKAPGLQTVTRCIAVAGLGLLLADLAPALAKPPAHAPAHGYRRKHGGGTTVAPTYTRSYSTYTPERYRRRRRTRRLVRRRAPFSTVRYVRSRDRDRDGIRNRRDRDIDGDGIRNWRDRYPAKRRSSRAIRRSRTVRRTRTARYSRMQDFDRDGIPNWRDRDMDGDGVHNTRDRYPNARVRR